MELEIKHIAPYLHFKLKINTENGIVELNSIDTVIKMVNFGWGNAKGLYEIKPLLYPKSHLYKLQEEMVVRWGQGLSSRSLETWKQILTYEMMNDDYNSIRYDFVQFMLENNIDVFGLIPAGLAEEIK